MAKDLLSANTDYYNDAEQAKHHRFANNPTKFPKRLHLVNVRHITKVEDAVSACKPRNANRSELLHHIIQSKK